MEELPLRGEPLRARLKELGMTQTDLADALGIRPQSVQHWVTGRTGPNSRMIPKVIEVLQLELESRSDNERLTTLEGTISRLLETVVALVERVDRLADRLPDADADTPATRPARSSRRSN